MIAAVAVTPPALVVVLVRVVVGDRDAVPAGFDAVATVDPLRDRPGEPTP